MSVLLCLTTCPDRTTAQLLAMALVEERLAACVNILPGLLSVYRWRDAIEQQEELQLFIKTTPARLESLQSRLAELHPYDIPEFLVFDAAGGLSPYLEWVHACVAPASVEAR